MYLADLKVSTTGTLADLKVSTTDILTSHQHSNQLRIGGRKLQRLQLRARDPAHLLADHRARLAAQFALEEMQLHHELGIWVRDRKDLSADAHAGVQLLEDLAFEAGHVPLAQLALSARKFPGPLQVRSAEAARQQERAAALDDGRRHNDVRDGHEGS